VTAAGSWESGETAHRFGETAFQFGEIVLQFERTASHFEGLVHQVEGMVDPFGKVVDPFRETVQPASGAMIVVCQTGETLRRVEARARRILASWASWEVVWGRRRERRGTGCDAGGCWLARSPVAAATAAGSVGK
jgi:hypothetical protein